MRRRPGRPRLLDRSYIGRLKVTGADGMDLLDRLTTNKLDDLVVTGQGMPTVLTSNKGRILDVLYVLKRDDHLLVLCGPESRQKAVDWIDFYTFAEDVSIQDITEGTAMLAIMGPQAPRSGDSSGGSRIYSSDPLRVDPHGHRRYRRPRCQD